MNNDLPQYEEYCNVPSRQVLQNELITDLAIRWKNEDEQLTRETQEQILVLNQKKELEIETICARYECASKKIHESSTTKQKQITSFRQNQIEAMFKPKTFWLFSWF